MVLRKGLHTRCCSLMSILWILMAFGMVAVHNTAAASTKQTPRSSTAQKKLDTLARMESVQSLHDSNYTRYAGGGRSGRPYHLVMIFSENSETVHCPQCGPTNENLIKVARAYRKQYDISTTDEPIVFAAVEYNNAPGVFSSHGIRSIPHAYVIPKGETLPEGPGKDAMHITPDSKGVMAASTLAQHVLRRTGVEIILLPDTTGLFRKAICIGVAVGIVAYFFAGDRSKLSSVLRCRGIWMTVSMACYMTGVGGMIYCIIRNPGTHGYDQHTRSISIFSSGGRDQFWYEGIVVGVLYLAMSTALIGTYRAAGWKRAPFAVREIVILSCMTVLCYVANMYFAMYTAKTRWYSLNSILGSQVRDLYQGSITRSHGLVKRLVRVSHLWLNEYTTMKAFFGKLKSLVFDYVVRRVKRSIGL